MENTQPTTLTAPTQNNYDRILQITGDMRDEIFWLRASYDDQVNQIFDMTEIIARQAKLIEVLAEKIEQWVGVAEE